MPKNTPDPFAAWTRWIAAGAEIARHGTNTAETLSASGEVIAARGAIIGTAIQNPWRGDHAELQRMIPEKLDAFSRSSADAMAALMATQAAWLAHWRQWGERAGAQCQIAAREGRGLSGAELTAIAESAAALALEGVEAASRIAAAALAPVHDRATANARRLAR